MHTNKSTTNSDRFDSKVELIPFSTCHYYLGASSKDGYGVFYPDGKPTRAHRYAWERVNGPIPKGVIVRHTCHERACVNVSHLLLGDRVDNAQDMVDASRQSRGESRPLSKLTEVDIPIIREDNRVSHLIAADYGVSSGLIRMVKRGYIWKHV